MKKKFNLRGKKKLNLRLNVLFFLLKKVYEKINFIKRGLAKFHLQIETEILFVFLISYMRKRIELKTYDTRRKT